MYLAIGEVFTSIAVARAVRSVNIAPMKARFLIVVALLFLPAISGCSATQSRSQTTTPTTSGPQTPTVEASAAQNGGEISVPVGGTLKLTLVANHSTPFQWATDTAIGDATVLQQTGHQYVADTTTTGGPGTEFWTFTALRAGTTTVANSEAPLGNSGGQPINTFTAKITVK
jgi:inhibitor of cysteine peptidase